MSLKKKIDLDLAEELQHKGPGKFKKPEISKTEKKYLAEQKKEIFVLKEEYPIPINLKLIVSKSF